MELVQTMLDLHKALSSAGRSTRTLLARRRLRTGRSAELYCLTEGEIELVEEEAK